MKQFFKTMFACILGVMIAGGLGFTIFIFSIISIASFSTPTPTVKDNSVLNLSINSSVIEVKEGGELEEILSAIQDDGAQPLLLTDIMKSINQARINPKVKGIYLNTDNYKGSYATSAQIRRELIRFKESGKFIIAYNNIYGQNQYFLSSVADSIYVNPVGAVAITGLCSKQIFFTKALEKFGIEPQIFRVGTFKSAIEPFMLDKMSDANRLQTQTFMNSIWNYVTEEMSESTDIPVAQFNYYADEYVGGKMAKDLSGTGLFTAAKYGSEVKDIIKNTCGGGDVNYASVSDLASITVTSNAPQVALLCAEGEIIDSKGKGIYAPRLIKEIEKIKNDDDIKGVVFRVNSPGGSAFASEQIWKAISDLKEVKPVVVSMGTYAASGGYYISCNADYIVSEPSTLTGSIGVFGLILNANKLLTKDIGLSFDEVKTNKFGQATIFEPLTPAERVIIQNSVEDIYELFVKRCADGRGLPVDSIKTIAEGRVWSGIDALKIGLVDELGGIDVAKNKLEELVGIENAQMSVYPRPKSLFESIMANINEDFSVKLKKSVMGEDFEKYQFFNTMKNKTGIQARMPEFIME